MHYVVDMPDTGCLFKVQLWFLEHSFSLISNGRNLKVVSLEKATLSTDYLFS